jgi:metallo-beta-lactamase class B
MKSVLLSLFLPACLVGAALLQGNGSRIPITEDLEVLQITRSVYVHVSNAIIPPWGRVASNGLIYLSNGEAILLDTPTTDSATQVLVQWITDTLKARIVGFVPNHWHSDCMGGLGYLKRSRIPSYASEKTVAIAASKGLPTPEFSFADSLVLHVGKDSIICRYLGAAHAEDNIVVWIPSDSVLFGGCMVKDISSQTLGNTSDADVSAWPGTITRVAYAYPYARIIVPGHGAVGTRDLLKHTLDLLGKIK